ncbi:MAG: PEGA domain-containing protein [Cellulosilyticaceae bacterium]
MKGNKLFVKSMIVTGIVGLATLMITMFIGIKWFVGKETSKENPKEQVSTEQNNSPVEVFNSNIIGVLKDIKNDEIIVYDIEKKQSVKMQIVDSTKIKDVYGKTMPISQLEIGEVLNLTYDVKEDKLIEIQTSIQSWTKTEMKNVKIDRSNRKIEIGQNNYKYTENLLIKDTEGETISIYQLKDYDTIELKGIDDVVHSIKVLKEEGYLKLEGISMREGRIEINTNRQISFENITENIPLSAGVHKIVIHMPGYEVISEEIEILPKEIFAVDLSQIAKAKTKLSVQVLDGVNDYTVKIEGKTYKKGEIIELEQGEIEVEVQAEGYMPWSRNVRLNEENMSLAVTLEPIPVVEEETPKVEESVDTNDQAVSSYNINFTTEPGSAEVFINGVSRGQTPINVELQLGTYNIEFVKEGYNNYETNIIVDNSDTQNNYYYLLQAE